MRYMPRNEKPPSVSRRAFLRRSVAATAGAVAFPYVIPASALGLDGHVAPSNRIVMGCIGVGRQGKNNMGDFLEFKEVQVVAVCDVDRKHRLEAKGIVDQNYGNKDCAEYNDFRELLARKDLNAVSIATPDHWHAIPAIASAKRGVDIYAEKPLSLTIPEGRAMVEAVQRYGVVWQTGSWQRSQDHFRFVCELVRNGRLGAIQKVEVGLPGGMACDPQPVMPAPEGFDYDFWLGPAPLAPYTEKRCHGTFRQIFDYSGGQLTDWAAHHCDIANWGMGTEHTGPIEVQGRGEFPKEGLFNTAINYSFECTYAKNASPVAPDGFTMVVSNKLRGGAKFIGTDGWISVDRQHLETSPSSLKESVIGSDEIHLYKSKNHLKNFLECMQTRKPAIAPIEAAHRTISIAHLGNIAMQLECKVAWNPAKEEIVGDSAANRKLSRAMRGSWHV